MRRQKMIDVTTELPSTRAEREQFGEAYRRWKWRSRLVILAGVVGAVVGLAVGGGELSFRLGLGTVGIGFVVLGVDSWHQREIYQTLFEYIDWSSTWGQSPAVPTDPATTPQRYLFGYVIVGLLIAFIGAVFPLGT